MKYALVNGEKREASKDLKGLKGYCINCNANMILKCGNDRADHWAHKIRKCDHWWENETDWHRSWKDYYPKDFQEVVHFDEQSGEKHIADVKTSDGLVIEFQHSFIKPEESKSRELFYKNMIWLVDGTRLSRDFKRFVNGVAYAHRTNRKGVYILHFPEECFPKSWLNSSVPVIFDFLGSMGKNDFIEAEDALRTELYILLPKANNDSRILIQLDRSSFIKGTLDGTLFPERPKQPIKKAQPSLRPKMRREPTHYYDPRKGKMVRRRRL